MDPPPPLPNDHDHDAFSDALDDCPFYHCSPDEGHDSPEPSASASTLCDPDPPPPSPAATLRRRSIRHRSPLTESTDTASDSDLIDDDSGTSFQTHHQNLEIIEDFEIEDFSVKRDSNQEKTRLFPSLSVVAEEKDEEESTLTTAAFTNDDALADSAGSSALELVDSPSSSLEYAAGLVIKAILFQIKIFIWLIKFPLLLTFHACMLFMDPFGTLRKGSGFFMWALGRVSGCAIGCISTPVQVIFKDQKSFWNVAFRCGWGFLWSIYVCCILFALVVSSIVFSGFVMKGLVEKPTQLRKGFNFDYTKQSPVAYVPIISCAGVGSGHDSQKDVAASRWVAQRVLPAKQNVQVTVSLVVPESGYNRNLGVFQIRADFLSSSGKIIASLSQPCMLKFRSDPIRLITTFLKIVPLLTGYISETQTLDVKIKGFVEGDVPTSCLRVTLEQRSEYLPVGAGIPQIYDSSVVIESEMPLFKRIIWHWKISIFIWITMTAFIIQFLFVLVCCWPLIIPRTGQRRGSARHTGT